MSKDILQYIHYYLGCEIKAENNGSMTYTLNKIGANGFASFKDKNGFDVWLGEGWKPILRKLDSVTEEEAIEAARIEGLVNAEIATKGRAFIQLHDDSYSLVIYSNGELESVKDGRIIRTTKANDIFNYLIKRKIWIFGNDWFDEGLIIDKATLK